MDVVSIRDRLASRLGALDIEVERLEAERRELLDDDFEEQAVAMEGHETLTAIERAALGEAAQIKAALARLQAGTYGLCGVCGEPIASARLEALPAASRCIACAE
ncbi:TraR/DksA C4-type zinc finger protein [Sphingobium sp. BS19]|uniref:TraR/DksA family transcriptional regulator n=1 Tax=Sphingobium sp. BS19 TaxID=3018973 RepID=UPI0022EDD6DE|nr:TraR/DksA C4-type zinc finger protein [Sphingobium sp. BS19]GLI98468.1 dimethylmenaquinone methyltransferase [Sphingobium sp. BS19]